MLDEQNSPIFIVGCSRGGTTVLHSLIAQIPSVSAFPEANIFWRLCDDIDFRRFGLLNGRRKLPNYLAARMLNRLGYTNSFNKQHITLFLRGINREDLLENIPERARKINWIIEIYVGLLSELSQQTRWVEKSPQNIFCLDLLEKYIPNALFLHIVRDGKANVASLTDAGRKYVDFRSRFGGPRGLERAVMYWNRALQISIRYSSKPRHFVVRYEDLCTNVNGTLNALEKAVPQVSAVHSRYNTAGVVHARETWKCRENDSIQVSPSKYEQIFSNKEKRYIESKLLSADTHFPLRHSFV